MAEFDFQSIYAEDLSIVLNVQARRIIPRTSEPFSDQRLGEVRFILSNDPVIECFFVIMFYMQPLAALECALKTCAAAADSYAARPRRSEKLPGLTDLTTLLPARRA